MKDELILQRAEVLITERESTIDSVWRDIERYVLPYRGQFENDQNSSENSIRLRRPELYDSTAIIACRQLASSMQANITSFSQKWFDLSFTDDEMNRDNDLGEWLEEVGSRIYEALNESNFDVEISEAYLDLASFGTTILFEEDVDGDLVFTAIPLREVAFEEDARKQVFALYRQTYMTAIQMVDKFGEDGVPTVISDRMMTPQAGTQKDEVIFCVFQRDVPDDLDTTKPIADKAKPVGYKYLHKASGVMLGKEGGYFEMPAYVTRWLKRGGSKWGYSPANECLEDIKTLNQLKEATLEAAGKAIDPANLTLDGTIIGDLELERGGLTVVTDLDGLRPYEAGTKFDVSNMEIGMLTESIRNCFYQNQLEMKDSPAMTATEANIRYELMQRLLGPVVSRLKSDLFDPMIMRTYMILLRRGDLPEQPEALANANMNINYSGVLPRSQKADVAQSIRGYLESIAGLSEIFPELRELIDIDAAGRELADLSGVPKKILFSQQDIDSKREAAQAEQAKQQQMIQAEQTGNAMQSLGKGAQDLSAAVPEGGLPPEMAEMMGGAMPPEGMQ